MRRANASRPAGAEIVVYPGRLSDLPLLFARRNGFWAEISLLLKPAM
jgi:hypothetical protein